MTVARPGTHPRKFTELNNLICPKCGRAMQKLSKRDHCGNCGHEVPWPKGQKGSWLGRLMCRIGRRHRGPFEKLDGGFVQCLTCGDIYRPGILMVDPRPPMPRPKVGPRPEPNPIERLEIAIECIDRKIASMEAERKMLLNDIKALETRRDHLKSLIGRT